MDLDVAEIKKGKKLTKAEFDRLGKAGKITDAKISSFGDGYGEPYNPNRLIWGYLDGEIVWTMSNEEEGEVMTKKEILELIEKTSNSDD